MTEFDYFRNEKDVRSFRAGEVIFSEGEPGDCFFAVLEGEVEIQRHGHAIETVEVGGVFGEMALIDRSPRSASAVASRDTRVAAIGQGRFTFLVQQTPFFALHIMHVLADRLRREHQA